MLYHIASVYGTSSYTTSNYNGTNTTPTPVTTTTTPASPTVAPDQTPVGATLANTGFDIALAVTLASLIIVLAVLVRFWKRPASSVQ